MTTMPTALRASRSLRSFASTGIRWMMPVAILATVSLTAPRRASAAVQMTADEFRLYKDYQNALQDPRVQHIAARHRLRAIARNFRVSERSLKEAIADGDRYGPNIGRQCEQDVRALLEQSELRGRVQDVKIDATDGHVVAYVSWKNVDGSKLDEEASLVALLTAEAAPITSTIALWSNDQATGRKVFDAKISADAAGRFSRNHIAMFASARYIRIFEDVHNAYKGTPPPN